jgi:dihydrodipicolinate synthase/N-acetylneuraminate lyase
MSSTAAIRGMLLPLPTVFDGTGEVDESLMREMTQFYLDKGVHAFFLCGSYGQGPAMSVGQRKRVAEVVMEEIRGRAPVVVHIGAVDPYTSIELGVHARRLGATAAGVVGPYYYSDRTEDELVLHFQMVDQGVQMPLFLYNNPAYQGYSITPALMKRLVGTIPRIFGAKLAMGGLDEALQYVREIPGFAPFALSTTLMPGLRQGVRGTVSPPLTTAPELGVELVRAIDEGRDADALRIQALVKDLNDTLVRSWKKYGRPAFAEGLKLLGFKIKQYPRWPTVELPEEERQMIRDLMERVRLTPVA